MIVFEPELWAEPVPKAQTSAPQKTSASNTGGRSVALWDSDSFSFSDVLDVINPLHHLPIISTIYREESGDKIGAIPRVLGSMLFSGGPIGALIGAVTALFDIALEAETGRTLGGHIYHALFGDDKSNAKTTTVAAPSKANQPKGDVAPGATAAPGTPAGGKGNTDALGTLMRGNENKKGGATTGTEGAAAKKGKGLRIRVHPQSSANTGPEAVGTQFRRSSWYQQNQAILKAQARSLAAGHQNGAGHETTRGKAAPAAAKTKSPLETHGAPVDLLKLFTPTRASAPAKTARGSAPAAITGVGATAHGGAARGGTAQGGTNGEVAGRMMDALSKYEALVKSRRGAGVSTNVR